MVTVVTGWVIAKLVWSREGESERQIRDVAAILAVSAGHLDLAYLDRWIGELGLEDLWQQAGGASSSTPWVEDQGTGPGRRLALACAAWVD